MAALDGNGDFHVCGVYGIKEVVVYMYGAVDLATAPRLLSAVQAALASGRTVIIDLAEVTFIDSQGIRVLSAMSGPLVRVPDQVKLGVTV